MLFVSIDTKKETNEDLSVWKEDGASDPHAEQTSSHSGPMWIIFFAPPDSLGSICPCPGSGTSFPVLCWGGSGGCDSGAVLSGFKSKVGTSGWVTLDKSLHSSPLQRVVMAPRSQGSGVEPASG